MSTGGTKNLGFLAAEIINLWNARPRTQVFSRGEFGRSIEKELLAMGFEEYPC